MVLREYSQRKSGFCLMWARALKSGAAAHTLALRARAAKRSQVRIYAYVCVPTKMASVCETNKKHTHVYKLFEERETEMRDTLL